MGIFDGIEKAEIWVRGKYLTPGFSGDLKIKRTLAKSSQKSGVLFTVEFEVVSNESTPRTTTWSDGSTKTFNAKEDHPIGSKVTWQQKMSDRTVALPAVAGFVAAVSGYELGDKNTIEREVLPNLTKLLDHACANEDDNALVGQSVHCEAEHIITQKNKKDFTVMRWSPVS